VLTWALAAALGGLLFGFHAGVVSGALFFIRDDFELGELEQGVLVSALALGAMPGALAAGRLADVLGRRQTLLLDAVVFMLGTGLAALAPSYEVLLLARVTTGLAGGMASSTVPLYVAEIAPAAIRGRLVAVNYVMVTLGIVVGYCVNLAFAASGSWRAMFAVGMLPAVALLLAMRRAPETRSRAEQRARQDPRRLLGSGARPALIIGATLAAVQQFSGINAIVSYSPRIMEGTGLGASGSIRLAVVIGAVNLVAAILSLRIVDRSGRRPLLLVSLAGMVGALVPLGLTSMASLGDAESWLSLACIVAYVFAFSIGMGPVFWLLIAEIFPPIARAAGAGAATAVNWLTNFLVGLLFLPVAAAIGEAATFWIFAAVCAFGFLFVHRYVPETKGRNFGEIDADVRERWRRERTLTVVHPRPTGR
jgi:MFS transporter, SP family, galactose:H+ symporter